MGSDEADQFPELLPGESFRDVDAASHWSDIVELGHFRDWHGVADSYFHAADALAGSSLAPAQSDHSPFAPEVIGPILFLYRHWLEVQLKAIAWVGNRYDGLSGPANGHFLAPPWRAARDYMEQHWSSDPAVYDTIEKNIMLFDELDRRSIAFRYPNDEASDPLAGIDIDLRRLRRVMRAIHLWLSGVWDARDSDAQNEAEMRWYSGSGPDG